MFRARGHVSTGPPLLAVLVVSLLLVSGAQAAAGDLDPTFSADGKQRTDFGAGDTAASAVVRQANGKIVAVGAADGNFLVARYNLDGSLDPDFSGDGRQQTDFRGFDEAHDVVLQGDGRIVVVGSSIDNAHAIHFALARYNSDGSLDTTFSGDGKRTIDFGNDVDYAKGVALQDDGKIVVVGRTCCGDVDAFAIARFNPNGSLDRTFSGDGRQTTGFSEYEDSANGVAVDANGKIVVAGFAEGFGFGLARYKPDGSLDTTFSGDGKQTTGFGGCCGEEEANALAIQANGKLVAAGATEFAGDFALARYNTNGSLDMTFSGDGKQTTDFLGADDEAKDLAIQASGRIVTVGFAGGGPTGEDFALARYNPDGTLDTSFSGDGRRRTNFGGGDIAYGVALQGDGRIVAAGTGKGEFALARYLGG